MTQQTRRGRLATIAAGTLLAASVALGSTGPALAAPEQAGVEVISNSEAAALKAQQAKIVEFEKAINAFRQANGVQPLTFNVGAAADAWDWSKTQARAGGLSHQQDHQRYKPLEGLWGAWGENVAFSSSHSAQAMFTQWKNSPGHRANMLNPAFTTYGIGFSIDGNGHMYGTTVFYAPQTSKEHLPYTYASASAYFAGQAALPVDGQPSAPTPAPTPSGPFTDVNTDDSFHEHIQWMKESGVTTGYSDGSYRPGQDITRAEAATFLYRISGDHHAVAGSSRFDDTASGSPHATAIDWMAENGYSLGYADGTFRPDQEVTRAELASFIYRASGEDHTAPEDSPFRDVSPSSPHFEAISWLHVQGGADGYTDQTFRPGQDISRGETAKMLHTLG